MVQNLVFEISQLIAAGAEEETNEFGVFNRTYEISQLLHSEN